MECLGPEQGRRRVWPHSHVHRRRRHSCAAQHVYLLYHRTSGRDMGYEVRDAGLSLCPARSLHNEALICRLPISGKRQTNAVLCTSILRRPYPQHRVADLLRRHVVGLYAARRSADVQLALARGDRQVRARHRQPQHDRGRARAGGHDSLARREGTGYRSHRPRLARKGASHLCLNPPRLSAGTPVLLRRPALLLRHPPPQGLLPLLAPLAPIANHHPSTTRARGRR